MKCDKIITYNKKEISLEIQQNICDKYIEFNYNRAEVIRYFPEYGEKLIRKILKEYNLIKNSHKLSDYYEYIINNQNLPASEIAENIGFSDGKVRNVLNAIKLEIENETLNKILYDKKYNKLNNNELSKKYNINSRVLGHYFNIHGLFEHKIRKNKILKNNSYFSTIDNYEKAYWLGFIYADGYVSNNSISISLSIKDIDVLYKFAKCLEIDKNNIILFKDNHYNTDMCKITINDKIMVDDINKIYNTHRKTYNMSIPNIDMNLFKYFLCGYFDGDGSVSKPESRACVELTTHKNNTLWLEYIHSYLNKNNIVSHMDYNSRKNCIRLRIWTLKDIKNFMNLIYSDENIIKLCLQRKYKRFKDKFIS